MAHEKGIRSLKVEILQYPTKENGMEAVCDIETDISIDVVSKGPFTKFIVCHEDKKREFATV